MTKYGDVIILEIRQTWSLYKILDLKLHAEEEKVLDR